MSRGITVVEASGAGGMAVYACSLAESLALAGADTELITRLGFEYGPRHFEIKPLLRWRGLGGRRTVEDRLRNELLLRRVAERSERVWILNSQFFGLIRPRDGVAVLHDPEGRDVLGSARLGRLRNRLISGGPLRIATHGPSFSADDQRLSWPCPPTVGGLEPANEASALWSTQDSRPLGLVYGRAARGSGLQMLQRWCSENHWTSRSSPIRLAVSSPETVAIDMPIVHLPCPLSDSALAWALRSADFGIVPHQSNPGSASAILAMFGTYRLPVVVSALVDPGLLFLIPPILGLGRRGLMSASKLKASAERGLGIDAQLEVAQLEFGKHLRDLLGT